MRYLRRAGLACGMGSAALCAHAQDTLSLSGILDYGFYRGFEGQSRFGSISRSNLALDARKQLDADLALTLRVSSRFFLRDPDSGRYLSNEDARYPASGEASAGVSGRLGRLRFGRAPTAVWSNDWNYDAWYNFDAIASPAWWLWHLNSPADPNASARNASFARLNDGLFYASPVVSGWSIDASRGTASRVGDLRHNTSIALKHEQQDFSVLYGRERTPSGGTFQILAGKVQLARLSVMAALDDERLPDATRNRSVTLSTRYAVGDLTYLAGYGRQLDWQAHFLGAGLSYAWSQSVSVYASYGRQGRGFWGQPSAREALGAGINYRF